MNMNMNKIRRSTFSLVIIFCLSILLFTGFEIKASAHKIDYSAESRAKNFLISIYYAKNCLYDEINTLYSVELYDDNDEIIAQVSLFDRDGKTDYAIYNYITESIDEYGLDCPKALEDFPNNAKLYYAGTFNYYRENSGLMINTSSGKTISQSQLFYKLRNYKEKIQKRINTVSGNSSKPSSGYDGFINWEDIEYDRALNWENSDWNYLDGITYTAATPPYGITGEGLSFSSMNSLSMSGAITNHCGPTALTNIMVYYEWLGMNTLLNNSRQDTFNRLRALCKHNEYNMTYFNDACSALKTYMSEMGYSVSLTYFLNDFSKYKESIDAGKIILTLLNVTEASGNDWGHFVVTLGYEEYRMAYEKQILWWTVTEYNYLRYIRICDNWPSCNDNRYVDLNNFYDVYTNAAININ